MDPVQGTQWAIASLSMVIVPAIGYLVKATITNDQKLKTHEATDALRFVQIQSALGVLTTEQSGQSDKLDTIVDRLPKRRVRS